MQRMFQQALLVLAMAALPALGADNSLGTWTVSIAKSTYTPSPMPFKSYTMKREAAEGGVKVTITGERPKGAPIKATYTAKFDGSTTRFGQRRSVQQHLSEAGERQHLYLRTEKLH